MGYAMGPQPAMQEGIHEVALKKLIRDRFYPESLRDQWREKFSYLEQGCPKKLKVSFGIYYIEDEANNWWTTLAEPIELPDFDWKELKKLIRDRYYPESLRDQWREEFSSLEQGCPKKLKVSFGIYYLEDEANNWWTTLAEPVELPNFDWKQLKKLIHDRYYPESLRDQWREKFSYLEQGDMNVKEYASMFTMLLRFVSSLYNSEAGKKQKFLKGLSWRLKARSTSGGKQRIRRKAENPAEPNAEKYFQMLNPYRCSKKLKVSFGIYYLEDEANNWWTTLAEPVELRNFDWKELKKLIRDRYYPQSLRDQWREEFSSLEQDDMNVKEYATMFTTLLQFVSSFYNSEAGKKQKLLKGLSWRLKTRRCPKKLKVSFGIYYIENEANNWWTTLAEPVELPDFDWKELKKLIRDRYYPESLRDQWREEFSYLEQGCPKKLKVSFGIYYLEDETNNWWTTLAEPVELPNIDWKQLKKLIRDRYYPEYLRDQWREKFSYLEQGDMNVKEYASMFTTLLRFVSSFYNSEAGKKQKFLKGLSWRLKARSISGGKQRIRRKAEKPAEPNAEKYFQMLNPYRRPKKLKVSFGIYYLEDEANNWWTTLAEPVELPNIYWKQLKKLIRDRYYPDSLRDKWREKFSYLEQGCPKKLKVSFGIYYIEDEANNWRTTLAEPVKLPHFDCKKLKKLIRDRYCPESLWDQWREEFSSLEQGDMNVKEYATMFTTLLRFVSSFYNSEAGKKQKFLKGLSWRLKTRSTTGGKERIMRKAEKPAKPNAEKYFQRLNLYRCPKKLKVSFGKYYLEDEANNWWTTLAEPVELPNFDWKQLKKLIRDRYYPESPRDQWREKFSYLEQGRPKKLKVSFGIYYFEDETNNWWTTLAETVELPDFDRNELKKLIRDRYYPESLRDQWREEFSSLEQGCSKKLKVSFGIYYIENEANNWWTTLAEPVELPDFDWKQLKKLIRDMYYPESLRDQWREKFSYLEQGDMNVKEYASMFTTLLRFVSSFYNSEAGKKQRFLKGHSWRLKARSTSGGKQRIRRKAEKPAEPNAEKYFQMLNPYRHPKKLKVSFGIYYIEDEANNWWTTLAEPVELPDFDRKELKKLIRDRYYPESLRVQWREKFSSLEQGCPKKLKVSFGIYYIEDEANNWWTTLAEPVELPDFDWNELKKLILDRYYPESLRDQWREEFSSLEQ
ncbi:hypothetical protein Droror1_Dr00027850, partial [Drosera rotundifolia]